MTGIFHRRSIRRHHILWCVLALLWLCQQVAFAASVCVVSTPPMAMEGMETAQPASMNDMSGHATHLMCAQHCVQGTAVQPDARSPNVPGSLLPPLAPAAPTVAMLPRTETSFASTNQDAVYRPSLRLLFCSLLI